MWYKSYIGKIIIIGVTLVACLTVVMLGFGTKIANIFPNKNQTPAPVYPTNENGQTYGSALYATSPNTEPDLIKAIGVDGTVGYVRSVDLNGPMPKTPEEALELQRKTPSVREIPLYAVDGKTVIGKFKIENGETQIFTDQPNN